MRYILILFIVLQCSCWAQNNWQDEKLQAYYYDFVEYGKNTIFLPNDTVLGHFFSSLDSLGLRGDRKVNIFHFGDSHIQADFFPNVLREHFLSEPYFGNGGRGFLFPFRLAGTNNPYHYTVSYRGNWTGYRNSISRHHSEWGVAGISAKTYSPSSSFTIKTNTWGGSNLEFYSNIARIYYPVDDTTMFDVYVEAGDSLYNGVIDSLGFKEFQLDTLTDEVKFVLKKNKNSQTNFLVQGTFLSNNDVGIVYHSNGVNGAKVDSYLKCEDFIPHLESLHPDLVIISLGTNDAYNYGFSSREYENDLRELIDWIRKAAPQTSILLTAPGDGLRNRWSTNRDNAKLLEAQIAVAEETGCAVWDFYNVMGGLKSVTKWHEYGLGQSDYLHLTEQGYELQGKLLYQALILNSYFKEHQKILR